VKKTCPRCEAQVSERAAVCRHCRYSFPEKSSPWAAGPALGAGFPLVMVGVLMMFFGSSSTVFVLVAGALVFVGLLLFFHPR
jgi:hypothetical protein